MCREREREVGGWHGSGIGGTQWLVLALLTGMEAGGGAAQHGVGGPVGEAGVAQVARGNTVWYHVVKVGVVVVHQAGHCGIC